MTKPKLRKIESSQSYNVLDLDSMSKAELKELCAQQQQELDSNGSNHNKISIADFVVESSNESLSVCSELINELISKHKDFANIRGIKKSLQQINGVG